MFLRREVPSAPAGFVASPTDATRAPTRREGDVMITVEALTKRYGSTTAVDGLTFTARPGTVTGF